MSSRLRRSGRWAWPSKREAWGAGSLVAAAVAGYGGAAVLEAARVASMSHLILFVAAPAGSIGAWLIAAGLLAAGVGAVLLAPALIGRIPRRGLRLAAAWTSGLAAAAALPYFALLLFFAYLTAAVSSDFVRVEAADGRSLLIIQDQFDGDAVDVYVRHDDTHYRWLHSAPELAGWPRVKDQNCSLETVGDELRLACTSGAVTINQSH